MSQFDQDRQKTLSHRVKLNHNKKLLYWYERLYHEMFYGIEDLQAKKILDIGSGISPLKRWYAHVLTSDILPIDSLDYVFDANEIDLFAPIADESLDIITLTNVLHHLRWPIAFLVKTAKKLKPRGQVILVEPYFSTLSSFIYKYVHHESVDMKIENPELEAIKGPLTTANIALPYLIFFGANQWKKSLSCVYTIESRHIRYYTGLSYMLTGGLTCNTHIPQWLFVRIFGLDHRLTKLFPRILSSFFVVTLIKIAGSRCGYSAPT